MYHTALVVKGNPKFDIKAIKWKIKVSFRLLCYDRLAGVHSTKWLSTNIFTIQETLIILSMMKGEVCRRYICLFHATLYEFNCSFLKSNEGKICNLKYHLIVKYCAKFYIIICAYLHTSAEKIADFALKKYITFIWHSSLFQGILSHNLYCFIIKSCKSCKNTRYLTFKTVSTHFVNFC